MGDAIAVIAVRGAQEYLHVHNLQCDTSRLAECVSRHCQLQLKQALANAKVAFDCGMEQVGMATFKASMIQAGIDAAKEATSH